VDRIPIEKEPKYFDIAFCGRQFHANPPEIAIAMNPRLEERFDQQALKRTKFAPVHEIAKAANA
jgi:hypothetical protein